MQALFDKELIRMEQEVRDLKTMHQRGLGTTRFYTYERQIEIPRDFCDFYFQATVENTNLLPMVMLPFIEGPTIVNFIIEFTEDGFIVGSIADVGTVTVRVITSQPLTTINTWTT